MKLKNKLRIFLCCFLFPLACNGNNIKVVIFDCGGFTIDHNPLIQSYVKHFKIKRKITSLENKGVMQFLKEDLRVPMWKIVLHSSKLLSMSEDHIIKTKFFADVKTTLQKISDMGYPIKVVTLVSKRKIEKKLEQEGLSKMVEHVSAGSLIGSFLNRKNIMKKYLKKNKLSPGAVLYIGDDVGKIQKYRKIGLQVCGISWGLNSKEGIKQIKPNFLIDKPEELLEILQKV
jgi:phosphoglycolate phosphatase-like HAD superfamily hydrolase